MRKAVLASVALVVVSGVSAFAQEPSKPANGGGAAVAPAISIALVPFSFSQKFEMPISAFFAEFNVREARLNQTLGEDAFAIPR